MKTNWTWPESSYKELIAHATKAWPFPVGNFETEYEAAFIPSSTAVATENGIKFAHFNSTNGKGVGCTVAYRHILYPEKGKLVELAVSYKNPKDQPNKKIGNQLAAERFLAGNTIVMPIGTKDYSDFMYTLANVFFWPAKRGE